MPGEGPSDAEPVRTVATSDGALIWDDVLAYRGGSAADGYITGSPAACNFRSIPATSPISGASRSEHGTSSGLTSAALHGAFPAPKSDRSPGVTAEPSAPSSPKWTASYLKY